VIDDFHVLFKTLGNVTRTKTLCLFASRERGSECEENETANLFGFHDVHRKSSYQERKMSSHF